MARSSAWEQLQAAFGRAEPAGSLTEDELADRRARAEQLGTPPPAPTFLAGASRNPYAGSVRVVDDPDWDATGWVARRERLDAEAEAYNARSDESHSLSIFSARSMYWRTCSIVWWGTSRRRIYGYDDAERVALLPTIIGLLAAKTVTLEQDQPLALPELLARGKH